MKRLRVQIGKWWRPVLLTALVAAAATGLLLYHVESLAPRLSPTESHSVTVAQQFAHILRNPLDGPYKVLLFASLHLPKLPEIWRARLPSVLLGLGSLALAAYILQHWYGRRSAVFGFLIFATSAWLLHVARFAGADIIAVLAILAVLATHINLHDHEDSAVAWFVWLGTLSLLLFSPGLVWLVVVACAWQWRAIARAWSSLGLAQRVLSALIPFAVFGVLLQAFILGSWRTLLPTWVGLAGHFRLTAFITLPNHVLATLSFIGWRAPSMPEVWLGDVPILNVFLLAMLISGIVFYVRHWQAQRSRMLGSYLLLGILLISLGGVSIGLIVPLLYLVAVAGIAYALQFWLRVFPRNPIARGFGISLITVLVGLSCYFGLTQYFVAWPNNPAVERVYQINH